MPKAAPSTVASMSHSKLGQGTPYGRSKENIRTSGGSGGEGRNSGQRHVANIQRPSPYQKTQPNSRFVNTTNPSASQMSYNNSSYQQTFANRNGNYKGNNSGYDSRGGDGGGSSNSNSGCNNIQQQRQRVMDLPASRDSSEMSGSGPS
uniref:Uncharacterized protein n=1 Tax=Lygus hesperus TaxID=30085 RepID=A0A0A9Y1V6_LYGHE